MSYDVVLRHKCKEVEVPNHTEGSTYPLGGRTTARLSVTYNYSPFYETVFPESERLYWLQDKTAAETIPILEAAVTALGVVRDPDYWTSIAGNAGYALNILLGWARLHPDAIWSVF